MRAEKLIIILSVTLLWVACNNKRAVEVAAVTVEKIQSNDTISIGIYDWLLGNWSRINEKKDKQTFENWDKKSDSEYISVGFTLQNNDTVWKENVKLIKLETSWNFEVTGKGETIPTIFIVTEIQKNGFTGENKKNEFPKKIKYYKNGNNINATISGGDMEILFEFKRVERKQ